jgi:2-polyprenyl-3-methyl-5-hydroxy-6-metoxy-1,4-benzoquinol methylase
MTGKFSHYSTLFSAFINALRRSCKPEPFYAEPERKRFLYEESGKKWMEYLNAAKQYPSKLPKEGIDWLHQKPYDQQSNHEQFFLSMYHLLNLLEIMRIPKNGKVLEVGCGPGWITEILLCLGYQIDAIEPSEDMIEIAEYRKAKCIDHYKLKKATACFHCMSLEEVQFPENHFDGILFHESLHHIIDEHKALKNCFKFLKPGGVLGGQQGVGLDSGQTGK